jgi:acetylornithine/succinyldiaminopimelate/putrescine aminotransferase
MTLRRQFLQHVGQTSPSPMMIEAARAEGVYIHTPEGKRYFDLVSGVSVSNVGHNNPEVVEAVQRQAAQYMHVMVYGEIVERPQVQYAARLAAIINSGDLSAKTLSDKSSPEVTLDSLYFVNSGAEAVEVALKLAKRATGRTEIISCLNAYHGSTHGALSVMGGEELKNAFRPLLPDTRQIRFNSFDDLKFITGRTACLLVEPVQGEAGVRLPARGWLEAARRRCDECGTMLIFDEIQTGFGRCGELFAFIKYGVRPDAVCLGKAFGGGMPLGGVLAPRSMTELFTARPALGHITTFGGHPVCCAAGLAAFEYIMRNGLWQRAEQMWALYEELLRSHPAVREVRRSGLMMAVELGDSERMFAMMRLFAREGIMSDWFLFCDTAFRISPPLTITEDEVRESCEIILRGLHTL